MTTTDVVVTYPAYKPLLLDAVLSEDCVIALVSVDVAVVDCLIVGTATYVAASHENIVSFFSS